MQSKQYWKKREGYVDQPKNTSQKQFLQDRKIWAKNDELFISDNRAESAPEDVFKANRAIKLRKKEVTAKPNAGEFFHDPKCRVRKSNAEKSWTNYEQGCRYTNRSECMVRVAKPPIGLAERAPLYSSFTKDKQFYDPKHEKFKARIDIEIEKDGLLKLAERKTSHGRARTVVEDVDKLQNSTQSGNKNKNELVGIM